MKGNGVLVYACGWGCPDPDSEYTLRAAVNEVRELTCGLITVIVLVASRRGAAVRPRLAVRFCLHGVSLALCRRRQTDVQVQFGHTGIQMTEQTLLYSRVQGRRGGTRRQRQIGRLKEPAHLSWRSGLVISGL